MTTQPLTGPNRIPTNIRCVAILFAGGPAPAANAVISSAAVSLLNNGIRVVGIMNGYSRLVKYAADRPLVEGRDYLEFKDEMLKRQRITPGIIIGTARTNPGDGISSQEHLKDPERTKALRTVHAALCSLGVDALISIGGDDTLKTANKFQKFQEHMADCPKKISVVHVPKTIDNDYSGIDFTFGYFTAAETIAAEIRNLLHDAEAMRSYFIAETMGRSAGWLAYGAAIAGEASLVISVEDITSEYVSHTEEIFIKKTGERRERKVIHLDNLVKRIVRTIRTREAQRKDFGVIVLAEGLAELLPKEYLKAVEWDEKGQVILKDVERDEHGHLPLSRLNLARVIAELVVKEYKLQTEHKLKVTGLQLGYESRCAPPHAFDVMLGSQLGVGAFRALIEKGLDGKLVSVSGQLDLHYVPFENLIDPQTLVTKVRLIDTSSDFHKLARFLETHVND